MTIAAQKPPEYASITTLARIRDAKPCREGWEKLLAYLGKTAADDEPLSLLTVLDSNGLDDALWVLSFAMPDDRLARHFQAWCAEQVLPLFEAERPDDRRVQDQIAMLRRDDATADERDAARAAAWAAAGDARDAARAAAWDGAWAGARAAARLAAWDGAWAGACAAQEAQLRKMLSE
jgi:hypothetical protein